MDDPEDQPPPAPAKPSKTPSWVMLGFVLGALAMLAFPWPEKKPSLPVTVTLVAPTKPAPLAPEKPTVERALFFEAVFAEWSKYAVWDDELTEVAFWSAETKSFSERFEVLRSGDRIYFRSITRFSRPLLTHGVPDNSPLQFTETQAARDEWLRENSAESMKAFLGAPAKKDQ